MYVSAWMIFRSIYTCKILCPCFWNLLREFCLSAQLHCFSELESTLSYPTFILWESCFRHLLTHDWGPVVLFFLFWWSYLYHINYKQVIFSFKVSCSSGLQFPDFITGQEMIKYLYALLFFSFFRACSELKGVPL